MLLELRGVVVWFCLMIVGVVVVACCLLCVDLSWCCVLFGDCRLLHAVLVVVADNECCVVVVVCCRCLLLVVKWVPCAFGA